MDLFQYVTDLPMPPKILRGTAKRQTSIVLTEQEDDVITYLAGKLPAIFDKKKSEVIRAAIGLYIWEMEDLVDSEWKPVIQQLKDFIRRTNYLQNKEAIAELLDRKSDMFNTLLDFGEFDGSLHEFDKYLDEIAQLPVWWQSVVQAMAHDHPEMDRFLNRVDRLGLEQTLAMQAIMEKAR